MTPEKINVAETSFSANHTDSNGTRFSVGKTRDIGGGHKITPLTTSYSSYYYTEKTKKTQVFLHFTVGSIKGDVATLGKKDNHVSVSYLVDRQGNIYNMFDDSMWSYHLGGSCVGGNKAMSRQSIGIEISNYGPLKLEGGTYTDAYKNLYTTDPAYVDKTSFRGYDYYAKMTDVQIDAVCHLLHDICERHSIPDTYKTDTGNVFRTAADALAYSGILCHTDVRSDKFDFPPSQMQTIMGRYNELFKVIPEPEPEVVATPEPVKEPEPVAKPVPEATVKTVETKAKPVTKQQSTGLLSILLDIVMKILRK